MDIIKLKITNCYLLKTANENILIDTGYSWEFNTFLIQLQKLNLKIENIHYLIITHCHDDHVGLVNKIMSINPNIKIIISAKGAEFSTTGTHNNIKGSGYINKRIAFILSLKAKLNKSWDHTFPAFTIRDTDIVIKKDSDFNEIDINLNGRILLTPGHTLDHLSVIMDTGECFTGDACANFLRFLGLKYCVVAVNSLNEYYKSWEKIIQNKATILYPSHGKRFHVNKLQKNIWKNKEKNMIKWAEHLTTAST